MSKYVCYYRVSTKGQNLGLEAQRHTCHECIKARGGEIIAEYSEKESGKNDNRPQMLKAIECANANGATFIVAKLDRLSRTLAGGAAILESIDRIAVCDIPELNTLTKGLFLTIAAHERQMISERTKKALAAKKAQGFKLGAPNATFTDEMRAAAEAVRKSNAAERSVKYLDYISIWRKEGRTLQAIADGLNAKGFRTPRNKEFTTSTIAMYLKRI